MKAELEEYRKYLENLVKEKSPKLFSNAGKDFASILMSILLKNTTNSVNMFCEGFKPDLIMEQDYWNALCEYLNNAEKKINVLVNTDKYINQEPLQELIRIKRERGDDTIQIRHITEDGRKKIKAQFNGALNNFAIFDQSMYRLEYEPNEFRAFGSFNKPDDVKILFDLFNDVFNISTPIDGNVG